MGKYLKYFAAVYSIALVLLTTVLIFGLNLGHLSLLPTLIVSALISARHFVKSEQRLATSEEKIQLVWGSSAVAIMIASFFMFFLVMMSPNAEQILKAAEKMGLGLYAVIMLCIVALHGAIFHLAYQFYGKHCLNKFVPSCD